MSGRLLGAQGQCEWCERTTWDICHVTHVEACGSVCPSAHRAEQTSSPLLPLILGSCPRAPPTPPLCAGLSRTSHASDTARGIAS